MRAMVERTQVDLETRNNGFTPLLLAARDGRLPVVRYLCEQEADKEARGYSRKTPLLVAAEKGHLPVPM